MTISALFDGPDTIEPEARELLDAAPVRVLPPGSSHRQDRFEGIAFLVVEAGFAVIRRGTTGGRGVVLCYAGPGALLPAPTAEETLDALVEARVTLLSDALYSSLLEHRAAAAALSDGLRSSLWQKQETIAGLGSVRPVERVQRKLLQLAHDHGRVGTEGIRVDFPVTHELLAEMVGTARETVSRAMERLERSGFVVRDGRSYFVQVDPGLAGLDWRATSAT